MKENKKIFFWLDLEMTGLGDNQVIIEIASIITDDDLKIIKEGPEIAIHRTKDELSIMESWPANQHKKSGLLKRVNDSKIDIKKAEKLTLNFLKKYAKKNEAILCGNSIWVDRKFLRKEMPMLEEYLYYRMIDVSSLKELISKWYSSEEQYQEKNSSHLALLDIRDSINELKWYREKFFINKTT
ncbi:MAG: oligoribonuclease [Chloroflexi bacterium]|nr:oligoribonuclease [Chloroflexota bacterium]|tara:strand:+ start:738 stop:1289 length:552 start_codon:yes stop_codon:yes gene_type:complete